MAKPKGKRVRFAILPGPIKKPKSGPKYPASFIGKITGKKK